MRIGVVFPQTELGGDAGAVRAYGERVEELGFRHVLAYDHVVGADPGVHTGWNGPYDVHTTFHEPLVMFGYLAAITKSVELVTGVIILPQRQTVLVAKQAAELAVLSRNRFRLGVGTGWNAVEYEGLNETFSNRGRRQAEQVELMRKLWTEESFTYDGEFHTIDAAGINPRPTAPISPLRAGDRSHPVPRHRQPLPGDPAHPGRRGSRCPTTAARSAGSGPGRGRPVEAPGLWKKGSGGEAVVEEPSGSIRAGGARACPTPRCSRP